MPVDRQVTAVPNTSDSMMGSASRHIVGNTGAAASTDKAGPDMKHSLNKSASPLRSSGHAAAAEPKCRHNMTRVERQLDEMIIFI
jgi:hypothetical protein